MNHKSNYKYILIVLTLLLLVGVWGFTDFDDKIINSSGGGFDLSQYGKWESPCKMIWVDADKLSGTVYFAGKKDGICVGKFNSKGDIQWVKKVNSEKEDGSDHALAIDISDDGQDIYVVRKVSTPSGAALPEIYLDKFDVEGNQMWSRKIFTADSGPAALEATGGYIYTYADTGGPRTTNLFLLKLDGSGEVVEKQTHEARIRDITFFQGRMYTSGRIPAPYAPRYADFFIEEVDPDNLSRVWMLRYLPENKFSTAKSGFVEITPEGDMFLVGSESHSSSGVFDNRLVYKTNLKGDLEWRRNVDDGNSYGMPFSLNMDEQGNLYYVGSYPTVVKLNTSGEVIWSRVLDTKHAWNGSVLHDSKLFVAYGHTSLAVFSLSGDRIH